MPAAAALLLACGDIGPGDTASTSLTATGSTGDAASVGSGGSSSEGTSAASTGGDPTTEPTSGDPTTDGGTSGTGGVDEPELVYLDPVDHLIRASMALRGIRPAVADMEAVALDPAALPGLVDGYLEDPRFAEMIKDLYAEALLLRARLGPSMMPYIGVLAGMTDPRYLASIPEEPLKTIEWVIAQKRPFHEIVTTDVAFVDEIGAKVWRVKGYDAKVGGWQQVTFDDDRPTTGGVLVSPALWHRHLSAGKNYNRGRANVVSRVFLCDDYLSRDVPPFDGVDFSDEDSVTMALTTNPGCVGCHQTLDPLASFFWGMRSFTRGFVISAHDADGVCLDPTNPNCFPIKAYEPADEQDWKTTSKREPGYFGKPAPGGNLDELGALLADDPRFAECAVRRLYGFMAQVRLDDVPIKLVDTLLTAYESGNGADLHAVARAIVLSDDFRVSHVATAVGADEVIGVKVARPEQLERTFFDLTGFRWIATRKGFVTDGEFSLLGSDTWGYRSMAGGIDGSSITQPTFTFTPTRSLTVQALAEEAAGYVVDNDLAAVDPADRKLLQLVELDSSEADVRAQLAALHARVLGELVGPDDPAVDASLALWNAAPGDGAQKWKLLLTAFFQDHRVSFF